MTVPAHEAPAFNHDRENNFRRALQAWPEVANIVADAQREGALRVMTHWHNYFRQSSGPGWVLVGDAGHFKDFTSAQGIADALCQARSLAGPIIATADSLAERDAQLAKWWRQRDRSHRDMYWLAMRMGRAGEPSPLMVEALRRVANDPNGPTDLLKVLNRDISPSKVFTVGRMLAAAGAAIRRDPRCAPATLGEFVAEFRTKSGTT